MERGPVGVLGIPSLNSACTTCDATAGCDKFRFGTTSAGVDVDADTGTAAGAGEAATGVIDGTICDGGTTLEDDDDNDDDDDDDERNRGGD
jgi:hypothetical protein